MTHAREFETDAPEALQRAVTEALGRKRRLGRYAVLWRGGRPVCVGADAPAGQEPYGQNESIPQQGVAESQGEDH